MVTAVIHTTRAVAGFPAPMPQVILPLPLIAQLLVRATTLRAPPQAVPVLLIHSKVTHILGAIRPSLRALSMALSVYKMALVTSQKN